MNAEKKVDLLKQVKELLSKPGAWCQGKKATTADGWTTPTDSVVACSWCLHGAVEKVSIANKTLSEAHFLDEAIRSAIFDLHSNFEPYEVIIRLPYEVIIRFNDSRGRKQEEVLALLDRAIELTKQAT